MSSTDPYVDLDLDDWTEYDKEPTGSKPDKVWLVPPDDPRQRWLWKRRTEQRHRDGERFWKGDDWAEKIATEVAVLLGIPVAPVELGHRGGLQGIVSRSIAREQDLALGNQVLADQLPDYRVSEKTDRDRYAVSAIFEAIEAMEVQAPDATDASASTVFAGYLFLDALVGNTDRHHENWGVLVRNPAEAPVLAPSFDHASSLGFQLADGHREDVVTEDDGISGYARRGTSRHFVGAPGLVDLAVEAFDHTRDDRWITALGQLDDSAFQDLVDRIPPARMSLPSRTFAVRLLTENRRRLLDEFDRSR